MTSWPSKTEFVILKLLDDGRELYGLEMIKDSDGRLKRGTIYVLLQRLEEKQFVDSRAEARIAPEIGIPRRLYRITALGRRVLDAYESCQQTATFSPRIPQEALS